MTTPLPGPVPPLPPLATPPHVTFSLAELSDGTVEFRVHSQAGVDSWEKRWTEVETPEIKRLFDEFTAAQQVAIGNIVQ
jgi:hypothetical protein